MAAASACAYDAVAVSTVRTQQYCAGPQRRTRRHMPFEWHAVCGEPQLPRVGRGRPQPANVPAREGCDRAKQGTPTLRPSGNDSMIQAMRKNDEILCGSSEMPTVRMTCMAAKMFSDLFGQ